MNQGLSRLWREPLLHFLLLGCALFVYYDIAGESVEAPPKRVHVERGQVQQLVANFERARSRPPTAEELDALVEGYVREEIFYREALAMGLDRDDPLVRRRLRMKLEFMLEDLSTQKVDDSVLAAYLQQNADEFHTETELTFLQVYLDPDRRPQFEADAREILAQLNNGADPAGCGDPTLVPRVFQFQPESVIARDLGPEFAREIATLPPGSWQGPLYSPFGVHLVKVERRFDARLPALDEIREQVLREYQADKRSEQKDLAFERLREDYEVTVEFPSEAGDDSGNLDARADGSQ
jgi:hypothetical protein